VTTEPVRLLLADDEHLIRGALAALLALEDDLRVVAQAASGPEALAMAQVHQPDIAVLDLQMRPQPWGSPRPEAGGGREVPPGLDGIEVAAELRRLVPGCRTMILTGHGRPGYLKRALEVGARGFLPKTVSAADLAGIIRTVHGGGRYVDPELAAEAISAGDSPLTPRETDVLELAADGASITEIAARAALSPGTVRNYLSSAVGKLGAENRHAAVRVAREHGWI
jgi:two-component system response regulator DesR